MIDVMDEATVRRVAAAIDSADVGYEMRLTHFVDGVRTYELRMDGKLEEFDNVDDVYMRIRGIKQRKQAEAVVKAMVADPFNDADENLLDQILFYNNAADASEEAREASLQAIRKYRGKSDDDINLRSKESI